MSTIVLMTGKKQHSPQPATGVHADRFFREHFGQRIGELTIKF